MSILRPVLAGCLILTLQGCRQDVLIRSHVRLDDIERMLDEQKKLTARSLETPWHIFEGKLTKNERQAMAFLYAYMPLSDLAGYSPAFFLGNVRTTLEARKEMTWGSRIPEEVFLHFVLPLRVNNENLDSFRIALYTELRDRVKGLNMKEAALEINHWCHEKVTYRPTDIRTSAPLSTIRKSFGRCGEESTFTVSALRAAGIPARQVYTPRWAHTDDNHAWVEVWVDGTWYFMGACEPEPELNRGWFSEPSRRVMLVHTRAYGRYFGDEAVISASDRFSELNLTATYAPVKNCVTEVAEAGGKPAVHVRVEFGLYNYAEFYPIASLLTDTAGRVSFLTGLGDLVIRASDGTLSDQRVVSMAETDTVKLILHTEPSLLHTEIPDLIPPHAVRADTALGGEKREKNNRRLAQEDSIRNAYMSTFRDSAWSAGLAVRLGLNADTVTMLVDKSYGNWKEVEAYLEENSSSFRKTLLLLATSLSDKDLSDTRAAILTDHLRNAEWPQGMDASLFTSGLLSPRIANEILSPWRSFLRSTLIEKDLPAGAGVNDLIAWIQKNITLQEEANLHSRAPLTPAGVYTLRVSDRLSRKIFFVAACRTMGLPARLNQVTGTTETLQEGKWVHADLDGDQPVTGETGKVFLTVPANSPDLRYWTHFTLGRLNGGFFRTLEFNEGTPVRDMPFPLRLEPGTYRLITGNRQSDGVVLAHVTCFQVRAGSDIRIPLVFRDTPEESVTLGNLDPNALRLVPGDNGESVSLSVLTGNRDCILIVYDPDKEPSKHVLQEISSYGSHFEKWQGILVFASATAGSGTGQTGFPLPGNRIQGKDAEGNILKAVEALESEILSDRLPLVVYITPTGKVRYFSAGYRIGIGEQLLRMTR